MKIINFYRYVYSRIFIFFRQVLGNNESISFWSSGYSLGLSLMSLPLVIDLIISRLFNIEGFFINTTRIGCLGISLFIFEMIVLYPDNVQNHSESINQKFTWSVEDILILLFVFGPMFLLPLLM